MGQRLVRGPGERDGVAHATLLALAGLNRLGLSHTAACVLDPSDFLPAPAQGRLYLNRALAISIAVKCATSPIQQQVRVIHEPSGEVVFTTTLVDRSPPVGLVPDLDES